MVEEIQRILGISEDEAREVAEFITDGRCLRIDYGTLHERFGNFDRQEFGETMARCFGSEKTPITINGRLQ